jgi:hypothetical protein
VTGQSVEEMRSSRPQLYESIVHRWVRSSPQELAPVSVHVLASTSPLLENFGGNITRPSG